MDPGSVVLFILLGILVVGAASMVTLSILLYKVLRRIAQRPVPGAASVRRSLLKMRATAGPAPGRELAGLRLSLQDSVAATFRSVQAAKDARQHIGRLEGILETLNQAAGIVDRQLAVAQKDPDPAIRRIYAETLGGQVEQILATSAGVRQALASTTQPMTTVGLPELTRRLDVEVQILQTWTSTFGRLQAPDRREGAA